MAFLDVIKLIFLPALIALLLYSLITYLILPLYRRYLSNAAGTTSYIPVSSLSDSTSGIRSRIYSSLERWLVPSHVRWQREYVSRRDSSGDELYFGEEEGERLVGFDVGGGARPGGGRTTAGAFAGTRGLFGETAGSGGGRGGAGTPGGTSGGSFAGLDSGRRLSRDLEQGFRDSDGSEEGSGDERRR